MEINICFSCSNTYVQHLSVTIASILMNARTDDTFSFYVMDAGISEKNKAKINKLKDIKDFQITYFMMNKDDFADCPMTYYVDYITLNTYYRFKIGSLLKNLDKVLYMDCDMVVCGDLHDVYNTDVTNVYLAAVPEVGNHEHKKRLNIEGNWYYFNAGFLLINLKKWNVNNIEEKLFDYARNPKQRITYLDQDILNEVLKYNVKYLHIKYNLQHDAISWDDSYKFHEKERFDALKAPIVIHYTNPKKPWLISCDNKYKNEYLKYLQHTPWRNYLYIMAYQKAINYLLNNIILNIFSIKKSSTRSHKIITCLGIKIKLKRKPNINDICYELTMLKTQQQHISEQLSKQVEAQQQQLSKFQNDLIESYRQHSLSFNLSDEFKYIIRHHYDNNFLLFLNEQIHKANAVSKLHNKVFSKYKNINKGKSVVLVATGPTLNFYNSIENAIYVGVNNAYKNELLNFDYMFYQDIYSKTEQDIENFISYQENKTIKFLGILNDKLCPKSVIPENYSTDRADVHRYYVEHPILYKTYTYDISSTILGDCYSIVFPAMQFILYTNPSKIYIVGCDCSDAGCFDNSVQQHTFTPDVIKGWERLRNFASTYYPKTEILSVNPVGLKGIFKDVYTESYLAEHPEIKEELGDDIEILESKEVQNI